LAWKRTKCLITGGASFIGSHLAESLLKKGATVRIVDDLSSGKLSNLSSVISDIEFIQRDLKYIDFAKKATADRDVVFHLAANHGGRGYIETHPANCAGNMALDNTVFECAAKNNVEKIVFASSACVYPTDIQKKKQLLCENMVSFNRRGGAFADEEYGWAKLMGEMSLQAYHKQYGVKAASARLSTAYGPRENESHALIALIAKAFIKQSPFEIWGTGEQTRGFTYVQDIVNGLILVAENIADASAVNIGTAEFISLNRIAEEIFKIFNWSPVDGIKHLKDKPVGVLHRALDGNLAKKACGWSPEISLKEGIEKTAKWYVENKDPQKIESQLSTLLMNN